MYAIHQYIFWTWSNWLAYQSILKRWLFSMLGWKYSYHVAAFKCGACTTLAVDYSRSNWGLIWTWTWAAQDSFESSAKVKEKLWKVLNHKAYIPPPFSHIFILSHYSQCLKITQKVAFNIASEASYVYLHFVDKSSSKMPKNGPIWRVFDKLKLPLKQCYQTGDF